MCGSPTAGSSPTTSLVLAAGTRHSYFGNDQWEQHAPGLKTVEDALEIRRRVLLAFERAERTDDPDERQAQLTFVVVGGGPTGVETAGAIAEIAFRTLTSEFRTIDPSTAQVILLEAAPRILGAYSEKLSRRRSVSCASSVSTSGPTCEVTDIDARSRRDLGRHRSRPAPSSGEPGTKRRRSQRWSAPTPTGRAGPSSAPTCRSRRIPRSS